MRGKARDVVPHRTARGRFDEIALEIEIGTLGDDLDQRREGFGEDAGLGVQIIWEFRSRGARFGSAAEQDRLPRSFDPSCAVSKSRSRVMTDCAADANASATTSRSLSAFFSTSRAASA